MYAQDFEYDGQYLSDYGFMICDFDGKPGVDTVSAGSKITFNTVSRQRGRKHSLIGTQYDECIQAKFEICKNPCEYDDLKITNDEYRNLMRWLNRSEFLKTRFIDEDDKDSESCYYNSSFNIQKIKVEEVLYGLELTMKTDKPFGCAQEEYASWVCTDVNETYLLSDMSDEIGYAYPSLVITCNASGDLTIKNSMTGCETTIKNCTNGEIIYIDGDTQIITSSFKGHDICNDFNYEFFTIGNTIQCRSNRISATLPCKVEIKYSPVIKDAP